MKPPSPIAETWIAVRAVRTPLVAIQLAMLAVAGAYALSPGVRASLVGLAAFRERGGFLFAAAGMLVAGVVVPELARRLSRLPSEITGPRLLALYVVYFAGLGAIIAELQNGMARLFGESGGPRGVLLRLAFDMVLFTPLVAMPLATVVFAWRDAEFRTAGVVAAARSGELRTRYVRLLVTCWIFWTPVLIGVYAMPLLLQFPLVLFAEAAWAVLMLALERGRARETGGVPA